MVGQTAYTPQICSIAWTRTSVPSIVVNRSRWNIAFGGMTANTGGSLTMRHRYSIPMVVRWLHRRVL